MEIATKRGSVLNGFIYAQTNDVFGEIETYNVKTGEKEIIGSWNEKFSNKVIYYLSKHHDLKIPEHFFFLSPANLTYMMKTVTDDEKNIIRQMVRYGQGEKILPFYFMGWVECTANTAKIGSLVLQT